jgi:energy-coupling factor transport system ATP-binding protein
MDYALVFENVSFYYPKFSVREVSFGIPYGDCLVLTGANGSGKTTLGKLASGLIKPSAGRIFADGADIARLSLGQIGARVGYLFQDPSRQLFASTVLEDLTFPLIINGGDEETAKESGREMLRRMGLGQLEDRSVFRLSGGEKQRLALAGLLIRKPRLLVLDEPTTGLDPFNRDFLGDTLLDSIREGTAILLITHDMEFADRFCGGRMCIEGGTPI